jgi:hypothetical protein
VLDDAPAERRAWHQGRSAITARVRGRDDVASLASATSSICSDLEFVRPVAAREQPDQPPQGQNPEIEASVKPSLAHG